ncbi:reverse transcriptase domain-containing protein [Corallococcus interemptor]|uniref:reverse transcriptase domain-containing protein n=1 Tax=Corallococcus interemptor TaxID=2316720 RepID=UPI003CFC6B40
MSVRVILEPSPEFAIAEVLWLRTFGPALDALLAPTCLANRLELIGEPANIPASGRRVYKYWVPAYRSFRQNALSAARRILEQENGRCILSALDLASYFDSIDPRFLIADGFVHRVANIAHRNKIPFNPNDFIKSTQGLLDAFDRFRAYIKRTIGTKPNTGIPVGSLSARLIANLALCELDKLITAKPDVAYYGRYVDDILIVQLTDTAPTQQEAKSISELLPLNQAKSTKSQYTIDEESIGRPGSKFKIQTTKLRVFRLEGAEGLEYLGAVAHELEQASSERRRFLDPSSNLLQHIVSASPIAEPIRALREADALSLRKLALSSTCEKVTTAAAMLSREEASKFSRAHLGKVSRIATDWSRWVDFIDQSNRLLAATLVAGDIKTATELLDSLSTRVASLTSGRERPAEVKWGTRKIAPVRACRRLQEWVKELLTETICSSTLFNDKWIGHKSAAFFARGISFGGELVPHSELLHGAQLLASSDLRWIDRETDHALDCTLRKRPMESVAALEWEAFNPPHDADRIMGIEAFRDTCRSINDSIYSDLSNIELLLLTRPPSYSDIMLRWLRAKRPLAELAHTVNSVRGTRYSASSMQEADGGTTIIAADTTQHGSSTPEETQLVLGNLCTEDEWWKSSLATPVLSMERQARLSRVLNQAIDAAGRAKRRGISTLLVLPELALPRRWLREVFRHIIQAEPSLSIVTGIEYEVTGDKVFNEAIAILPRSYMSAAGWIWTKRNPAHHEAPEINKEKLRFSTRATDRRFAVLHSEHGRFIPLICSELLEVDARSELLGRIDLLLVPAWNPDTTSFEHLVHSAALELHCFVGVANNGKYSDCRVRGPYSETWRRESARLISRQENETVVAELPVGLLRMYHSNPSHYDQERRTNQKHWPAWKPMPPGMAWTSSVPSPKPSTTGAAVAPATPLTIRASQ